MWQRVGKSADPFSKGLEMIEVQASTSNVAAVNLSFPSCSITSQLQGETAIKRRDVLINQSTDVAYGEKATSWLLLTVFRVARVRVPLHQR
jgi:hypothetical protein